MKNLALWLLVMVDTMSQSVVIDRRSNLVFVINDITGNLNGKSQRDESTSQLYWAAPIKAGKHKSSIPFVLLVATHHDQALASGKTVFEKQRVY